MRIDLSGKRVLVTGGNGGLGAAMCRAFAAAGARVGVSYQSGPDKAQAVVDAIKDDGGEATAIRSDVSDPDSVGAMFESLDRAFGGIDILVNNAGIDGVRAAAWDSEVAAWTRVIAVNLTGAYLCAREALRRMVAQRAGVVLNTSSVHERIPWGGYSAYAASKAGLSMMAKTLALEAAPHGVRVLCIAPGAIKTPINRAVWSDPQGYRDLLQKIPLGRIGTPEEIADLAVMLASDRAGYVTGTTVFADGGMTNYPDFSHGG
jgi:NAD(P)-dependent dehydrogenase (short-subunit alcohol dehydrogenase family)